MTDLLGRWDIVSWVQAYDDGRVQHPMGEDLVGFLRYSDDGAMTVMIARRERPAFVTGGQWDASDAEKAAAYQSMLSYAGRWELDGDHVVHHVELSLYPGWVGGVQRRRVIAGEDATLTLEARLEDGTPQARTARLVWQRPDHDARRQR